MEYIPQEAYEYIINKYHDTALPFDPLKRFVRHDKLFSPETGMDADEIKTGILEQDVRLEALSHPVRKARALQYVLENTRIACDSRDIFPAINAIDRPLLSTVVKKWKKEVLEQVVPEAEAVRAQLEREGIANISLDYSHSVPNWDRLLQYGFPGLLEESEKARNSRALTEEEDAFFEGIKITYEAVIAFLKRLEKQSPPRLAKALRSLQTGAPTTFYEGLLLVYLYFMISEHVDYLQVRSLSNFDRNFYGLYEADLSAGVPEEEIRRDLAFFLLQFTAIGNYWNQPVYLGGEKADGTTEISALSHLFLDVYDKMGLYNPKIQIKVAFSTPKDFLLKALDMIRRGRNSIVFVSDSTIRSALEKAGVSREEARLCHIKGCYEYAPNESYSSGMTYINLLKPLEYALHGGRDGVTGTLSGSPAPESYESFEAFYAEYKKQLRFVIDRTVETTNALEDHLAVISPLSLLSGTFQSCLQSGKDAIGGGSTRNNTELNTGYLADAADSLAMIQKYVFENRELTLPELTAALDANFEGHELLRLKLYRDREKYGNNKPRPDAIAADIVRFITECLRGRANSKVRGGGWDPAFHVARMSYTQGKKTAASPNGRRFGEELSKNISPSLGRNREGATAAILSATGIDATEFVGDASLDLALLPGAVRGADGLEAMYGLLMTFVSRKGHAMHINVFDAQTLRDAQKEPEKYQDLQIRVCGWNVLWNNISPEEQEGFIRQAESLI